MFDNPKKELEKLEKQLLEDEEWFQRELDSAKRMIGQSPEKKSQRPSGSRQPQKAPAAQPRSQAQKTPAAQPRSQAPKKARPQTPAQEPEAPMPKKKGTKGLLILMTFETLGILGLVAYWVLVLLR